MSQISEKSNTSWHAKSHSHWGSPTTTSHKSFPVDTTAHVSQENIEISFYMWSRHQQDQSSALSQEVTFSPFPCCSSCVTALRARRVSPSHDFHTRPDVHKAVLIPKGKITHSEVSFFSSLSSLSCLLPGPDVCTPWEVTSGPRFCSELLLMEGEILGLLGLLLPPLELVLLPASMIDSLGVDSVFSLTTSLGFSPSRVLFSSWSTASEEELDCNWKKPKGYIQ